MQSSLNSFFSKTTPEKNKTPEKSSPSTTPTKSLTPTKSSPKTSLKSSPSPTTQKSLKSSPALKENSVKSSPSPKENSLKSSPSETSKTPEKLSPPSSPKKSVKSPSSPTKTSEISPKSSKVSKESKSPERETASRKRKADDDEEGPEENAKRVKEEPTPSKGSFSSDALLDDDSTLANMDLPPSSSSSSSTPAASFQDDDAISDDALYTMEMPTSSNATPKPAPSTSSSSSTTTTSTTSSTTSASPSTPTKKPANFFQLALGKGDTSASAENIAKLLTEESWKTVLQPEFKKPYFTGLAKFLDSEKAIKNNKIFPPESLIFNALNHASFDKVRVVILGQDPYVSYNQAMGMSFSVPRGQRPPPSLNNIFKELATDIPGFQVPNHGDLTKWADQGVLLLNAVLTVRASEPNSHKGKGWESLTAAAIKAINTKKEHVVFLLWGKDAQTNAAGVDTKKHLVLKAVHPSPKSADRGFFGCKHFSKANKYLSDNGLTPIDWSL